MSYLAAMGLMGYTIQFRIVCRTVCGIFLCFVASKHTDDDGPVIAEIGLVSHKTCLVVLSTHTPPPPICLPSRCTNNKNNFYDSLRILFRISSAINVALNNPSIPARPIPSHSSSFSSYCAIEGDKAPRWEETHIKINVKSFGWFDGILKESI